MLYIRADGVSVRKWAKANNVCYKTIYDNIQRGYSVEDACTMAAKRRGRKDSHVKYFVGKRSLRFYCMQNGLNYRTVCRKIKNGMTINQALRSFK
jgi:hypothetical protein